MDGKVIADYKPDVDYGSDPENKPDSHEEDENSYAEYWKMVLP